MAARAATLDLSALSPAEWSSYEQWLALVDNAGKLSPERMLALVARAVGPLVYNRAREEEILAFFDPRPPVLTAGQFLAILRLLAHGRQNAVLCRDHIFLQTPPLRLSPASLHDEEEESEASNPYRRVVSDSKAKELNRASMPPPLPSSANPFRSRTASAGAALYLGTPRPPLTPPSSAPSNFSPPLPPRPSQRSSQGPPSTSTSRPPPPKRTTSRETSSKSTLPPPTQPSSIEVIASSATLIAPTPRRPRISSTTELLGSLSERGPPPLPAPKPKLVSSTHIGPSTRLRPTTPSAASLSDSSSIPKAPSLSSSSSGEDSSPPVPLRPLPSANLGRAKSLGSARAMPPPPPKRRTSVLGSHSASATPSTFQNTSSPASLASRSEANSQNRPLEAFLPAHAAEWLEKARRRATMPTSAPAPDREALMASQRRQVGSEDEASLEDEELGAERERLRTEKESGWTALR